MKMHFLKAIMLSGAALLSIAMFGCNSEPQPTQGDAEIIKSTPKNTDPPSKKLRDEAPLQAPTALEVPPNDPE